MVCNRSVSEGPLEIFSLLFSRNYHGYQKWIHSFNLGSPCAVKSRNSHVMLMKFVRVQISLVLIMSAFINLRLLVKIQTLTLEQVVNICDPH